MNFYDDSCISPHFLSQYLSELDPSYNEKQMFKYVADVWSILLKIWEKQETKFGESYFSPYFFHNLSLQIDNLKENKVKYSVKMWGKPKISLQGIKKNNDELIIICCVDCVINAFVQDVESKGKISGKQGEFQHRLFLVEFSKNTPFIENPWLFSSCVEIY